MSRHTALAAAPRRGRITSVEVLCVVLPAAMLGRSWLVSALDVPAVRTAATVFVAVCVQALSFLVFGVFVSGALAAFVPAQVLRSVLPRRPAAVGMPWWSASRCPAVSARRCRWPGG